MKLSRTLCFGAAITLPQFALAEPPVSVQSLAETDSTLDFCAQSKPESAQMCQNFGKHLEKHVSRKDLEDLRNSAEYQEASKTVSQ